MSSCVTLHYAYTALGIEAHPRAVDLVVTNRRTDTRTLYGRPDPYWSEATFHGHCVLWLRGSGRFIDPTVEQYPDVRDYGLGPICGRLAASLATPEQQARIARGELIPGTHIGVEREDLLLLYTTVGHEFDDVVMSGAPVIENLAEAQRSGRNLAAQCIAILCQPDVIERARQAPHPRVRALLDLLTAAETTYDDAGDLRFILPGDSDRCGRRLDELGVPALGPGLSTSAATTNGMPMQRAAAASGGELSVPGMLDVVDQDETHSCPTERRRRGLFGLLRRERESQLGRTAS